MKLTNRKIKKLIRESLKRILFESEERIQQLKDQEALLFLKRKNAENAGDYKAAQDLTQKLEMIKKEYESLEKKKARVKEREPSEFDEMFVNIDTSKQVVPHKQKSSRRGFFSNIFNREDTPGLEGPEEMATFDVTPGSPDLEFQDMANPPMTAKEKQQAVNRRGFLQGLGATALLGRQIFDFYKDTLYEDFMMMSEAEKIKFVRSFVDSELQNMPGALEHAQTTSGAAEDIIHEIIEKIIQHLLNVKNVEDNPLYDDLYEILEDPVGDYIDELIGSTTTKTISNLPEYTPLTEEMIELAIEVTDNHFDYNGATEVISTGTLDDIESFERTQSVQMKMKFSEAYYYETQKDFALSPQDARKLLLTIRAKVDKIMSRLGGP